MRKYYAALNSYGSATSVGFANTWLVLAFVGRAERDRYVTNRQWDNRSVRAITRRDIGKYIDRGAYFTDQHWAVDPGYPGDSIGMIGEVKLDIDCIACPPIAL